MHLNFGSGGVRGHKKKIINSIKTRLNMLFIPTLPVKADFAAMLIMLSNVSNAENAKHC